MNGSISNHVRGNAVAYLALFAALGGTAIAASIAPKNSVVSKSIKDGQVKKKDVASSQVQLRIGGSCAAGEAIRVVNADGTVACEPDDMGELPRTNSLGSPEALAGDEDQIIDGAIDTQDVSSLTGADIRDDNLTGADIDEATLSGLSRSRVFAISLNGPDQVVLTNGQIQVNARCAGDPNVVIFAELSVKDANGATAPSVSAYDFDMIGGATESWNPVEANSQLFARASKSAGFTDVPTAGQFFAKSGADSLVAQYGVMVSTEGGTNQCVFNLTTSEA